jgi:hypothetical protein
MSRAGRYWRNQDAKKESKFMLMDAENAARRWIQDKNPADYPAFERYQRYMPGLSRFNMTEGMYADMKAAYEASLKP